MVAPTQQRSIEVGSVLGGSYEVLGEIGRGGMGVVFEAKHLRLPKRVAIKVLRAEASSAGHDAIARFRREAEIASRLGHPHIAEVLDFGEAAAGQPYIVLELLDGRPLDEIIDEGPMDAERVKTLAGQIGSALTAAHDAGVVHRDLKPSNVIVTERDGREHAVVLDFGISKILGSHTVQTETATVLGTPGYMAPEQAKGEHDSVGPQSDVFALAAIVFEMISGRPAFEGDTMVEVAYKLVHAPRPTLRGAPAEVARAIEHALEVRPDKRTSSVAAFVAELDAMRRSWMPVAVGTGVACAVAATAAVAFVAFESSSGSHGEVSIDAAVIVAAEPETIDAAPAPPVPVVVSVDAAPVKREPEPAEKTKPRSATTGGGAGKAPASAGCVLDATTATHRRCRSFVQGRCTGFGEPCGTRRDICLFDAQAGRYRMCSRTLAGRCERFIPRDCVPDGKRPCMRTTHGVHRVCKRSKSGRCLEFGGTCSPGSW